MKFAGGVPTLLSGNSGALGMDQVPAPFARVQKRVHESKNDPTKNRNWNKPTFSSAALEDALRNWIVTSSS